MNRERAFGDIYFLIPVILLVYLQERAEFGLQDESTHIFQIDDGI